MNHINIRSGSSPLVNPASDIFPLLNGIRSEVRFGMASRNCSGLGICSVEATNRTPSMNGACDLAIAYVTYETFGQLCFYFLKATVCLKAEKKHFRRGVFMVRETFELPGEIVKRFKTNNQFVGQGQYPVIETDRFWRVIFNQYEAAPKEVAVLNNI